MANSAGWPLRNWGLANFLPPNQPFRERDSHVRRCEPSDKPGSPSPTYDPQQAYASLYLQAGLGHAAVAFVGDVIAQRVEGRFGTKIRDPHEKEEAALRALLGGELAGRWADWRASGVAKKRQKRAEEKERVRLAQEEGEGVGGDDEGPGGTPAKPPLAGVSMPGGLGNGGVSKSGASSGDVSKSGPVSADVGKLGANSHAVSKLGASSDDVSKLGAADVSKWVAASADVSKMGSEKVERGPSGLGNDPPEKALGGSGERGIEGGVRKSEGVLSFVHSAFKGFLNMSPLGGGQNAAPDNPSQNEARVSGPSQRRRSGPRHDPDDPPGYSLLRSLRMASFAFFVDHPMTNFWTQSIRYNPRKDKLDTTLIKLVLAEAVLTPSRFALLFTWDSLLQRKPKRIGRKLRADFRPAVVRSLQVAAFENAALYGLSKEIGVPEVVIGAVVSLPVSLYINFFQSTITAR